MKNRKPERGSALLLTAVIGILVLGLGAAFFTMVMGQSRTQESLMRGGDALLVSEAGIVRALEELRSGIDYDKNGVLGGISAARFNHADYAVQFSDPKDGTFILTAEARKNGVRRAVEVRVAPGGAPVPAPGMGAQAALAILGQLGKKGKVAIHMKKPSKHGDDADADGDPADDDAAWTSESTSPIAVDGHDSSRLKATVAGLGIEDPDLYAKVTQKIAEDIRKGKIPADTFLGDPMNTIYDKKGNPVSSSITPLQTGPMSLNYENMNVVADQIEKNIDTTLIPNADTVVTGKNVKISSPVVYGTPASPQTVVFDADKLEIQRGGSVTGYGNLIVTGDAALLNDSVLNWTGNVIILGGKNKDATLKNKKGNLTVDGTILVLGGDSTKKKSKLELHNDIDQTNQGNTTNITGAVLVWTGNNTDKAEKAEFKAKHGHFNIDGFIGVYGDKTKFDVKIDDKKHQADGHFVVQGGVVVAVAGNDDKHKAKVHLHGDDILINYNSFRVEQALERLKGLMGQVDPSSAVNYSIVAWREIPAPGLLAAKP